MSENYYDTLGVLKDASDEDIKSAYRKIAKVYHPDKKPDNKVAEEIFREATRAYETLKDPVKRKKHDSKFSWALPRSKRKFDRTGTDLRVNIKVSRIDLINCAEIIISVQRIGKCNSCEGTGSVDRITENCKYCNGTGLEGFSLALGQRKKCNYCKGLGSSPGGEKCKTCKGAALLPEIFRKNITLNPFMSESIVLLNSGNYCYGGNPGNLIVNLNVIENPLYDVKNLEVSGTIKISPAQAVLGDTLRKTVFNKNLIIEIPAGTSNGQVINIEGGGISHKDKSGNFKATVKINIPTIITKEEKEIYLKLLRIEKEAPWPKTLNF